MSDLEPKKMKVAELREELKLRGLDPKGNKAQLVKRLEKSLKQEAGEEADTSQEMDESVLDSSQDEGLDDSTVNPAEDVPSEEPEGQPEAEEPEDAQQVTIEQEEEAKAEAEQPEQDQPEAELKSEPEPKQAEPEPEPKQAEPEPEPKQAELESKQAEPEPEPKESEPEPKEQNESKAAENEDEAQEKEGSVEEIMDGEEDPEGEAFDQQEFQVMDSVEGDSEAPEADQKMEEDRRDEERRAHKRRHSPGRDRHRRSRSHERHQVVEVEENEDWIAATHLLLDKYNSDLNLRITEDCYKANPITVEGFAFMWAGARGNYGVDKGKVCFEVKVLDHLNVEHLPSEESNRHVVRVGFSTDSTTTQLGEEPFSYGFGGTGKASTDCKFNDYGETFGEGDVIGAYVDFEAEPVTISYTKNGEDKGTCFEIEVATLEGKALFPHVLTKNCEFEVNFGNKEEPYFPAKEGFTFINDIPEADRVRGSLPPAKKEDCEIIMMCGLPGAGKTFLATKKAAESPEKKFNVLGTNNIIEKMKVMGLPRKRNYAGRWDVLIDKSTKCLNRLLEIASKKKRNYILDQTNVYPTAQRRKMRPFEGFQRKAVVIVPTDEEFKNRCAQREKEEGKEVPDSAVLEMKANFQLPDEGQLFDKVEFVELEREEAQKLVEQYNKEGRAAMPPPEKRMRGGGGDRYGDRYGRGRDNRGYGRYDRDRGGRGGYRDSRSYGGYDRRGGGRGGGYGDRRRGGYMGYSSADRQRVERSYDRRDSGRSYDRSSRWSGQGNWSGKGSWGGQGNWGNQGGSWGNQGWGNQGWGNHGSWGGQGNWGGQWSSYNQNQGNNQNWGQGYYNNWNNNGWNGYGQNQGWYGNYSSYQSQSK